MIQKITCFCLLSLFSLSLFSQSLGFERNYRLQDEIEHLTLDGVSTTDGGFICLSLVTERDSASYKSINIVKLDKKGSIQWSKDYVVEDSLVLMKEGDLHKLSDNRLGINVSLGRDSLSQIMMVTDNNGNIQWSRRYAVMDSLGSDRYTPRMDEFNSLTDTILYQAGNGIMDSVNTTYISSLDNNGIMNWAHQIAKPTSDTTYSNLHLGAFTLSHEGGLAMVGVDEDSMQFYITRVDDAGMLMWNRQVYNPDLDPTSGVATGIVQLPDSSYVITGKLFTQNVEYDGFVIKTDSTGITQWSKKIDFDFSINDVHLNDVVLGSDASLIISARQIGALDSAAIALKLDYDGNVLWQSKYKSVATTNVDLGGLDTAFGGKGLAFFTTGGSANGDEDYIPNLIVADSMGMTMCSDTIMEQIVTDNAFVSDTLELVVMPYMASDTIAITQMTFSEFDVPIVVLDPGVYCSNEAWSHEMDAFQEDATNYVWTDGEDVIGLADSLVVTEEGQYDVTVFMGGSYCFILCDTVNVEEYNLPELTLFTSEPLFCSQGLMTINTFPNAEAGVDSVTWSTGETGLSINVDAPGTYSATLTDDCGLTVDAQIDVVFPILVSGISLVSDVNTLCDIGSYSLEVIIDPADAPVTNIVWSTGTIGSTTTTFNMDGTYSVTVSDYCNNEFVETVTLTDLPTIAPTTGIIVPTCQDENVLLQLVADVNDSHQIEWSSGEMDVTSITVEYGTGPYTVSITDFCGNVETVSFDLADLPNTIPDGFSIIGECNEGGPVLTLTGDVGQLHAITWSTGATSESIQVPNGPPNIYSVTITDFCRNENVLEFNLDDLDANVPPLTLIAECQEDGVFLSVEGDQSSVISYDWDNGESTPTILGDFDTNYNNDFTVVLTDICNDIIELQLLNDEGEPISTSSCIPLTFPNAFLPDFRTNDEDGVNAIFGPYVQTPEAITNYELAIYNRWGEKVYESVDFNEGWDGIYKDNPQPGDVYLFYSSFAVYGREVSRQGDLTLLR